jgi:pentatricopeptide repeat protein
LALPFEWQEAVIRASITLKLSHFEESGAIVAAMTTSIPEGPDSGRNWDYRYCWLRDAFFVVRALNRLGATKTMEGFLDYINDIVARSEGGALQPVFDVMLGAELDEREVATLAGYRGMGPVRVGNQAYRQVQNDGYGSVILASAQTFFDHRLTQPGDDALFARLERLGEEALARWDSADAGLWELRTRAGVHTFSSLMCWAALDRLAIIAHAFGRSERSRYWRRHAERLQTAILERAWNDRTNSFVARFDGDEVDASLLLMPELGLLPANDPRAQATLARIEKELLQEGYLFRYATPDDFGEPKTAFAICTFWYIDALAGAGRVDEARELFEHMLSCRTPLGLLAEDIDPRTGELWGNFPQTYSMVGLINSAMRLSRPWEEAF